MRIDHIGLLSVRDGVGGVRDVPSETGRRTTTPLPGVTVLRDCIVTTWHLVLPRPARRSADGGRASFTTDAHGVVAELSSPCCRSSSTSSSRSKRARCKAGIPATFQPHAQPTTLVQSQLHSLVPRARCRPVGCREVIVPPGTAVFPPSQSPFQEVIAAPAIPSRLSDSSRCRPSSRSTPATRQAGTVRSAPPTATVSVVFCASPVTATATPFVEPGHSATAAAFCSVTVPDAPGLDADRDTRVLHAILLRPGVLRRVRPRPFLAGADAALI